MKVYDGFVFNDDYDVLELRLEIMYDHVDKITIVESDHTFSNKPKDYNFEKNIKRYEKWLDKINYIKVESPKFESAWDNEHWQSAQIKLGWSDATPEDVILAAINVDEIIRPETIELIKNTNYDYYTLWMPIFYFKLNYTDRNQHYSPWAKAFRGVTGGEIISPIAKLVPPDGKSHINVHHSGWHFSWLGDNEYIKNKLKSYSHTEFDNSNILDDLNIEENIKRGEDHLKRGSVTWSPVKLDDYFPKVILDNKEKYSQYILPDSDNTVFDFHGHNILELV